LFACPEQLFPKEACDQSKVLLRQAGLKWTGPAGVRVHPMRDGRRVPIKTLMKRLRVTEYDHSAPMQTLAFTPQRVVLPLKQGAGTANSPVVRTGDQIAAGQPIGEIPGNALGAIVHAPFAGRVKSVGASVVVERTV
jgi:hypothetical protein